MQKGSTLVVELPRDIKRRYEDMCLVIFKEHQKNKQPTNFLRYGTSRRTFEYSNNGNSSVLVRKPDELTSNQKFFKFQVFMKETSV